MNESNIITNIGAQSDPPEASFARLASNPLQCISIINYITIGIRISAEIFLLSTNFV